MSILSRLVFDVAEHSLVPVMQKVHYRRGFHAKRGPVEQIMAPSPEGLGTYNTRTNIPMERIKGGIMGRLSAGQLYAY